MKTIYYTATSLDGYIADQHDSLDWLFQLEGEGSEDYPEFIEGVGALAMGSTTYEWVRRHLAETGEAWPYEQPAWVFSSRTREVIEGADIRFVSGDVRPVHAAMLAAAGGRNVWLAGGGELVGQFHDHGLLDELIVTVGSVTLGGGAPLLPRRITNLRLTAATQLGHAFVKLRYEVAHAGR